MGGGGKEAEDKEAVYSYDWFKLLYGRNQHNIVRQLSCGWKENGED